MIVMMFLLYLLQMMVCESHQMPTLNENKVRVRGGEIMGNQSDVEVVNSSELLNMLKSCTGCLVTIKNPQKGQQGLDTSKNTSGRATLRKSLNTTQITGLYMTNDTKVKEGRGNGTTQNKSQAQAQTQTQTQAQAQAQAQAQTQTQVQAQVSELGDMLRKCQGCYVDNNNNKNVDNNKKKSHTHTSTHKVKHKKVKGTSTKDYESKVEDRSIQPPETPEVPGNIPYGESEISATNEVPPLDNTTRKGDSVEFLSDEQLGNAEPFHTEMKKRKSKCKGSDTACIQGTYQMLSKGDQKSQKEFWKLVDQHLSYDDIAVPIKSKLSSRRKSYHAYNDTEISGEKRATPSTTKSELQKYINSSVSQTSEEQVKNNTDNFNPMNTTENTYGEVEEIKDFSKPAEVEPLELRHMIEKNDVRLIDLREDWELTHEGKISKGVNIPRTLNSLNLALRSSDKNFEQKYGIPKPQTDDCKLVFLDKYGGERADIAYKYAKKRGYRCSKSLKGGFDLWKKWISNNNDHLLL